MTATREIWMLFATFVLLVLFGCFFIFPNYRGAQQATNDAVELELRIEQLERRQLEVEKMHEELIAMETQIQMKCKRVPSDPDMAQIVKALSLEVDGEHVFDQSFTAGSVSTKLNQEDSFSMQPLAVTMHSDFDSIFSVIKRVESMNRLVRVSSVRVTRKEAEADATAPVLEAAIGLHAMYDTQEGN
jgi:Tfp pilus assembly protein PilO